MKILVVEDEHKVANAIKRGLEQETFTVDVAYDGEKGFDLAADGTYDVILLDIMLPKMDGVTICKKLREEENVHTPILMLTAKGQVEDKVEGLNAGADDYLPKPFAFTELLARIHALHRRPQKTTASIWKAHDLTINSQTHEVTRGEKSIDLSKTEYTLLKYLLRNKNKTLTKDQIIDHVWPYDADVLPNTVEVYIGYLRNKIDKPFPKSQQLIKTVRGFGYKLTDK